MTVTIDKFHQGSDFVRLDFTAPGGESMVLVIEDCEYDGIEWRLHDGQRLLVKEGELGGMMATPVIALALEIIEEWQEVEQ